MPDFIICRANKPLDDIRKKKIETYANIKSTHVISEPDIDTIYRIPLDLEKEELGLKILDEFKLNQKEKSDFSKWEKLVENIVGGGKELKVAIVGKYVDIGDYSLADSYVSINQALQHAGANLNVKIDIKWVDSKSFEKDNDKLKELKEMDGIIIPGGFGGSGVEGKILAIQFARENNIPFLGLCYGMQLAVVEYARNVCNMEGANTTEVDKDTKYPIIDILPAQKKLMEESNYGGTMRLGAYAAMLKEDSKVLNLYKETGRLQVDADRLSKLKSNKETEFRIGILEKGKDTVLERHRHRFEVNPEFISKLEDKGLVFSGYHIRKDEAKLMEFIELPDHKYFVATQAHPEFKSTLTKPAPLFHGFVKACSK